VNDAAATSRDSGDGGIYVYGVVTPANALAMPAGGIGTPPAPVRAIPHETLAALVSPVPAQRVQATRANLGAHLRVLQEAMDAATVLPMRFGVVFPDEDAVRAELLVARRGELEELARRLAGHVQLDVRAFYDEDALLREVVAEHGAVAALRERVRALPPDASHFDRIRLGELVADAVATKRVHDEQTILERLRPLAADLRVEDGLSERVAFKGSFLVAGHAAARFDDVLDELARGLSARLRFKVVGPLPPHGFVDLDDVARAPGEAASWAS
jgi:hypothetical protein